MRKRKWRHSLPIDAIVKFFLGWLVSNVKFNCCSKSTSWLVLELRKLPFIKDWLEIRKSEILLSELCQTSGDWDKLQIPNLAQMSLVKSYWIIQNCRVTAFTFSVPLPLSSTRLELNVLKINFQGNNFKKSSFLPLLKYLEIYLFLLIRWNPFFYICNSITLFLLFYFYVTNYEQRFIQTHTFFAVSSSIGIAQSI